MATNWSIPKSKELEQLYESLKNWTRWGREDQRGTLNHLTRDRQLVAAGLIQDGIALSLAHDLSTIPSLENLRPAHHHMLAAGDARDSSGVPGYEGASDYIGLHVHGTSTTHVDALSHIFVNGEMYGGRPSSEVRSDGAKSNSIMSMAEGVVGKGVLLDIPRVLGIEYLEEGEVVTIQELEAAEAAQNLHVGRGDILLVTCGRDARRSADEGSEGIPGLHPECLPWLRDREIAMLGGDGISDPVPFLGTEGWPLPIHQIGIASMGMPLIDNMSLSKLAERCTEVQRWEFLFTLAPLRIPAGTGSPVNPVALL